MILCMLVGGISYTIVKVVETTDEKHESLKNEVQRDKVLKGVCFKSGLWILA